MEQTFRLLAASMGDLSDRVGELVLQVRDNLQFARSGDQIEARLGLTSDS
jgi:hypothetical protein